MTKIGAPTDINKPVAPAKAYLTVRHSGGISVESLDGPLPAQGRRLWVLRLAIALGVGRLRTPPKAFSYRPSRALPNATWNRSQPPVALMPKHHHSPRPSCLPSRKVTHRTQGDSFLPGLCQMCQQRALTVTLRGENRSPNSAFRHSHGRTPPGAIRSSSSSRRACRTSRPSVISGCGVAANWRGDMPNSSVNSRIWWLWS
jgi:hypothetical protein